jgi:ribonuclease HI
MSKVTIYTDGACSGNPGPGGYGVLMQSGKHTKELSQGYRKTTNNRMELMAVIAGLKEPRARM